MIDIDVRLLIFQIINFGVLFLILRHFLFDPVSNFMQERSQGIEEKITEAEKREKEAIELKKEYEQKLREAKEKAQEIVEESKQRGKERKEEIVGDARAEADRRIKQAEEEIARAKQQAVQDFKDKMADHTTQMARQLLEKSINRKLQEETIDQYIDQLDQESLGEV